MSTRSMYSKTLLFAVVILAGAASSIAQVSTGTIAGNISDSTSAAVPNATVVITDTSTGIVIKRGQ